MFRLTKAVIHRLFGTFCPACGKTRVPYRGRSISDALAEGWGIDKQWRRWYDDREATVCRWCYSSRRSMQMAAVLVEELARRTGQAFQSLVAAASDPIVHRLRIAEVNACGCLHQHLLLHPSLQYAEYGGREPGTNRAVPHEDITRLSYPDASLDLVLTSETLEHVAHLGDALAEIRRVLAPGGAHVFTAPIVWGRPTRQRADLQNGTIVHLLPPTYHGGLTRPPADDRLVFWEFGEGFADHVARHGFAVTTITDQRNPALNTFVAYRV